MSSLIKQSGGFVGELTMSSREIAELTGKRHDNVMADIKKMLLDLELNAPDFSGTYKTAQGNEYPCFSLPKRETLILVSGYSVELRAKIIDRWQELEQKELASVVNPAQLSRMQLLQMAMEAEEEKLALEAKIEEQAPKVETYERIADAAGSLSIRETATTLEYPERRLVNWLILNEWAYRRNGNKNLLAYASSIKKGWLMHRVRIVPDIHTGEEKVVEQMRVTSLGLTVLAEKLDLAPSGGTPPPAVNAYLEARG